MLLMAFSTLGMTKTGTIMPPKAANITMQTLVDRALPIALEKHPTRPEEVEGLIMLEELFHSGRLRRGQRLFLIVPESGRFSICYATVTVV